MKKMLALMLCAILMMSCVAGMAVAEETKPLAGQKLTIALSLLAALLAAGNLSFWLCDRALAALTRYYHLVVKPKLKKKF